MELKKKINFKIVILIITIIFMVTFFVYDFINRPKSVTTHKSDSSTTTVYCNSRKKVSNKSNVNLSESCGFIIYSPGGVAVGYEDTSALIHSTQELKEYLKKVYGYDYDFIFEESNNLYETIYSSALKWEEYDENFFKNKNLAIIELEGSRHYRSNEYLGNIFNTEYLPDINFAFHNYAIKGTVEKNNKLEINIKDTYIPDRYKGMQEAFVFEELYIIVPTEKTIENVNFNIYRTTKSYYPTTYFLIIFIYCIVIDLIIVGKLIYSTHKGNSKNKLIKMLKYIGIIIIGAIILIILFVISFGIVAIYF